MGDYYYDMAGGGGGQQKATTNKDFRTYPAVEGGGGGIGGIGGIGGVGVGGGGGGGGGGGVGGGMEIVNYNPSSYRPRSPDRVPVPPRKSTSSQSGASIWGLNDPETKRRRRVASYKAYSVEGRVKASIRTGFRWIKTKCSQLVHGW